MFLTIFLTGLSLLSSRVMWGKCLSLNFLVLNLPSWLWYLLYFVGGLTYENLMFMGIGLLGDANPFWYWNWILFCKILMRPRENRLFFRVSLDSRVRYKFCAVLLYCKRGWLKQLLSNLNNRDNTIRFMGICNCKLDSYVSEGSCAVACRYQKWLTT